MKKCPVPCYIVTCMQDLNDKLFSLYSLALTGQVFPGLRHLNKIMIRTIQSMLKKLSVLIIVVTLTNFLDFHVFFLQDCTVLYLL